MKLTFLGTSNASPKRNRYCTSVMIEHSGYHYILDLGAPVVYLLAQQDIPLNTVKGIFLTHLHPDHADALTAVTYAFNKVDTELFLPEKEALEPYYTWMQCIHIKMPPEALQVKVTEPGVVFDQYGMKVTAVLTDHLKGDAPSYAYIFEADGKRVLFSGDLGHEFHDYPSVLKEEDFDLVVMELAHIPMDKAQEIFKGTRTKQMIFYHLGLHHVKKLAETGMTFEFPYLIASDGFQYDVI